MAEADITLADGSVELAQEPVARPKRRWGRLALMLALPIALLVGGFLYWQTLQGKVSTDNAYLKQDKVGVSAEIVGKIVDVRVQRRPDGQGRRPAVPHRSRALSAADRRNPTRRSPPRRPTSPRCPTPAT